MHLLADEIRETFDERGWKIERAVQSDQAFGKTRRPQSSMGRALVLDAIEAAVSRIGGLGYQIVSGGACDISDLVDDADRRFRVRKAEIDPNTGTYKILAGSDAILTITDAEPDSLWPAERWVLGYTVDDEGLVVDIFAARLLGISEDAVPLLELGAVTLLGTVRSANPSPGGGFQPPEEEDLGGLFGDADTDDTGEASAG